MPLEISNAGRFPRQLLWGMVLIPCIYLPTLASPFDFNDDGYLAYPAGNMSWQQFAPRVFEECCGEFREHGPFRPVCRAHWLAASKLIGAHPLPRRIGRLLWCGLATALLMCLLREFRFSPPVILVTSALTMWTHAPNEIWLAFGLTEAFGMPYALAALILSIRAARSTRPLPLELGAAAFALLAIGCKNTFAAIVPAQIILRWTAGEAPCSWRRSMALGLTLIAPITHFILFKRYPNPTHYQTSFYPAQPWQMLRAILGAVGADFMMFGLGLAILAVGYHQYRVFLKSRGSPNPLADRRPACLAGLALIICGIGVYLPMNCGSGRYIIPAVWGAYLGVALLLAGVERLPSPVWRRSLFVIVGIGLAGMGLSNVAKQQKLQARAELLWQALRKVEQHAGPCTVVWDGREDTGTRTPGLSWAEGIHFGLHLQGRGRGDIGVVPSGVSENAKLLVSMLPTNPGPGWRPREAIIVDYWLGRRSYRCYLWQRGTDE
jgi:hypothetical protein